MDIVNEITGRVSERGMIEYWMKNCAEMQEVIKAEANDANTLADEFRDLNMEHMQSAFYLLFFGQGLSTLSFLTKLLYYKCFFMGKF